ncbi:hypothetical protein C2E23DRAFT_806181 [Lenzites betulinus]|nr:hypothetical protein C2E23DRAFT_806181 [Lenzites betulinus]
MSTLLLVLSSPSLPSRLCPPPYGPYLRIWRIEFLLNDDCGSVFTYVYGPTGSRACARAVVHHRCSYIHMLGSADQLSTCYLNSLLMHAPPALPVYLLRLHSGVQLSVQVHNIYRPHM